MHPFVAVTQCNKYWSYSEEKTASFISGIHYEHYIAHTSSIVISTFKCDLVNLTVKNGSPLEIWKQGVSIMSEKVPGNYAVEKLWALLLLKKTSMVFTRSILSVD